MQHSKTLYASLAVSAALVVAASAHDEAKPRKNELFKPGVEQAGGMPSTQGEKPPLMQGMGDFGMKIVTSNAEAQAYFDQGLGMLWGFNHAEAIRNFKAAQAADPNCAMCYWGEAYALGPNLNMPMSERNIEPARAAAKRAAGHAVTPREMAITQALLKRYAPESMERADLDKAFADAMGKVVERWPADANLLAVHADAMMNLQPWDYWEADGVTSKGSGARIVATLEKALEIEPAHPAALHLYIHAVEASANPARAEAAADRLRGSVPAAGHLVHMPAHIYNRIGRYADSVAVNEAAIAADEAFLAQAGAAASPLYRHGYYPHNVHFLLIAAQSAGLGDKAIAAAEKLAGITSDELSSELAWVQAIRTAPYTAHAQFSDVGKVLTLPAPGDEFPFLKGFYHYARGTALAMADNVEKAEAERQQIVKLIDDPRLKSLEEQYLPARDVLRIAALMVEARMAQVQEDYDSAATILKRAVRVEASLPYMEPPYWPVPVARTMGAVELQAGRLKEAEAAFEAALKIAPRDGWALWGMAQVKAALDPVNAGLARAAFKRSWLGDETLLTLDRL